MMQDSATTQESAMPQDSATTQEMVDADSQRGRLWFIFLSGPVIYIVYFLVVWALGEFGCLAGIQQLRPFGLHPIYWGVLVLTAVAALTTLIVTIVAFRRWRYLRQGPYDPDEDDPKFMLFVGTWLNGIFTVAIAATAVPMLLGSSCGFL